MHTQIVRSRTLFISSVVLAVAVLTLFTAMRAYADTAPVVSVSVINASNDPVTSAPIGTLLSASTTVATSTGSVTGTVDFTVFKAGSCSGVGLVQSDVSLVNGRAQSAATSVPSTGLSYSVHYDGDANNVSADSGCVSIVPTSQNTSISTTLSTTSAAAGTLVHDSATLNNVTANASGTVAYSVYTNNSCNSGLQSAGVKTVTNGSAPNSNDLLFNTAGTYYWQAVYSGDSQNTAATSSCQNEVLTIVATTTPPTPPANGTGIVSGVVFNDQNKNDVRDGSEPGLAGFTIWLHQKGKNGKVVKTATTDSNGNYSFSGLAFGKYFVEEQTQKTYKQTSDDMLVTLSTDTPSATVNFANVAKNNNGNGNGNGGGHGGGDDGDDDGNDDGDNDNHGNGFFGKDFFKGFFWKGFPF